MSYNSDIAAYAAIFKDTGTVLSDYELWLINQSLSSSGTSLASLLAYYTAGFNTGGFQVSKTNTIATSNGAYTAVDCIGTINIISAAMRAQNKTGIWQSAMLIDLANQQADLKITLFNDLPVGTYTDKTTTDITTDISKVCGVITITAADYITIGDNAIVPYNAIAQCVNSVQAAGNMYFLVTAVSTPDYGGANKLIVNTGFLQNA